MQWATSLHRPTPFIISGGYPRLKSSSSLLALSSPFSLRSKTGFMLLCLSLQLYLPFRAFKARGRFLGRAKVHSVVGDHLLDPTNDDKNELSPRRKPMETEESVREVFLPIDHLDGSNPSISLEDPYPGIFIYRFSEGFNYPNANHYLDQLTESIFKKTRRTNPSSYKRLGDRPWNDPGPRRGKANRRSRRSSDAQSYHSRLLIRQ